MQAKTTESSSGADVNVQSVRQADLVDDLLRVPEPSLVVALLSDGRRGERDRDAACSGDVSEGHREAIDRRF